MDFGLWTQPNLHLYEPNIHLYEPNMLGETVPEIKVELQEEEHDVKKTCRLCKNNLVVNGVISNSRTLFCSSSGGSEPPLCERFLRIGVVLHHRPAVSSGRICTKCYRLLVRVEEAHRVLDKWKVDVSDNNNHEDDDQPAEAEVELELEENSDDEGWRRGGGEKRKDSDDDEMPPKKMRLGRAVSYRSSTTEVFIKYPSNPRTQRYRCDCDISGVINNLAKGRFTTAAKLMVHHQRLMAALKPVMAAVVDKECQHLCHPAQGFVLWKSSPEELRRFSLDDLREDLERMAPFTFSVICAISGTQRSHACAAAAIALRGRDSHLSAFSYYVGRVLRRGGARKAVFTRLSRMGISTTHHNAVRKLRLGR